MIKASFEDFDAVWFGTGFGAQVDSWNNKMEPWWNSGWGAADGAEFNVIHLVSRKGEKELQGGFNFQTVSRVQMVRSVKKVGEDGPYGVLGFVDPEVISNHKIDVREVSFDIGGKLEEDAMGVEAS